MIEITVDQMNLAFWAIENFESVLAKDPVTKYVYTAYLRDMTARELYPIGATKFKGFIETHTNAFVKSVKSERRWITLGDFDKHELEEIVKDAPGKIYNGGITDVASVKYNQEQVEKLKEQLARAQAQAKKYRTELTATKRALKATAADLKKAIAEVEEKGECVVVIGAKAKDAVKKARKRKAVV